MIERPIITELFEKFAVDIVGPLLKSGDAEHILTILYMASRWPEAIPLRKITDRAISEATMPVFSRIVLPLHYQTKVLSSLKNWLRMYVNSYK